MFEGGLMLEQKIKKKIFRKLESISESLDYDIESLTELKANIQTIYLFLDLLEMEGADNE